VRAYAGKQVYDNKVDIRGDYCRSKDINDIYNYSAYVFKARVTGIVNNALSTCTIYNIVVGDVFKGEIFGEQMVLVQKNQLKDGEEYLFMVSKPDENSSFYTINSLKSVLPASSAELLVH
jgi:hypothetical protein